MTPAPPVPCSAAVAWLRRAFFFAVVGFMWWRFSENTADNDLWGHVLYGQRMLHLRGLETVETLSWTAAGQPWINHEVLAEVTMGLVHRLGGGTGLWVMMLVLAGLTLGLAWRAGAGSDPGRRLIAAALLALSTNFIALGYAVRPQLFTFLFFVITLLLLRRLFAGRLLPWSLALPLVLMLWANTHGGYLAGWVIVTMAMAAEGLGALFPSLLRRLRCTPFAGRPLALAGVASASLLALAVNPWGWKLTLWTVETLRLPRPQLYEWQAMSFNAISTPYFFVLLLGMLAWVFSRQPRRLWEMLAWALLAFMAFQHVRHAPLFGLASVALLPVHVQDLLTRLARQTSSLRAAIARPALAIPGIVVLLLAGGRCLQLSVSSSPQPFRMEVPRALFPVAAIEYMQAHQLTGDTLTFFDWGQQVLWELPDNRVSFDGRLDTVYSQKVMTAHWMLYAGDDPGPALPLDQARFALLPTRSGGVDLLFRRGWTLLYHDPLATVLTRKREWRPLGQQEPVAGGDTAIAGAAPFPDALPVLGTRVSAIPQP